MTGSSRWTERDDVPRGDDYDARFARLEAEGASMHGEADLVADLAPGPRILDAGCGTGRVAIELHRRGFEVSGLDLDPAMLASARRKAPELTWHQGDLADRQAVVGLDPVDLVVLAGNVLIFVAPGTEAAAVANAAAVLASGGLVVAGFTVRADGYGPARLDEDADAADLGLVDRWSSWDREPWTAGDDYQVSVHRKR